MKNSRRAKIVSRVSIGLTEWDVSLLKEARSIIFPETVFDPHTHREFSGVLERAFLAFVRGIILQAKEDPNVHPTHWMVPRIAVLRRETAEEERARIKGHYPNSVKSSPSLLPLKAPKHLKRWEWSEN